MTKITDGRMETLLRPNLMFGKKRANEIAIKTEKERIMKTKQIVIAVLVQKAHVNPLEK